MCARRVDACCERCEDMLAVGRGWLCALAGWLERKGRWRSNLSARACCLGETGSTEGAACFSCTSFFDASVVRYPSSYSYAATYETRSLTPVAGYEHGTSEKNRRKHHTSGYDFILFPKTTVLFIHAWCMISYHFCFHTLHVISSYLHDHTFILMPRISYFELFHT